MNDLNNEDLRIFAGVLVQAAAGAEIQAQRRHTEFGWEDKKDFDKWFPKTHEYRVKPEPREVWVNIAGNSLYTYMAEDRAHECMSPEIKYDGIAIHFKEVIENDD